MDGGPCPACAFEPARYDRRDLLRTLTVLAPIWRTMTEATDAEVLTVRPPDDTSASASLVELVAASRAVVRDLDRSLGAASEAEADGRDAPSMKDAVDALERAAARVFATCKAVDEERWVEIDPLVTAAVHDGVHRLRAGGRALHALGAGAPHQVGTLVRINAGGGGVPKAAVPNATIDGNGVVGDAQADRVHHGAPLQALCVWSADVQDALNAEGHSLFPGAAGENLTLRGIDWTTIRPGVRLTIGPVVAEISAFAVPCTKNAQWFAAGDFRRMDHVRHPGWSRAYAWVLAGGDIRPGDDVVVE
jgi:MOSC domain-containing protein YiiM